MSIIETKNLSFSYGSRKILNNINLSVEEGVFLSILGSNGVGKSTLFKCMLGLNPGFAGDIFISGCSIKAMSPREISSKIAYIPQHTAPAFNFSVEDIVLMGTTAGQSALSKPGRAELDSVAAALEKVGIESLRQRCFHQLSGGEKQLVIIARALAQNARTIMLDEPTASLDFGNQMRVLRQIKALSGEGYTIIQTTHNPEHAYMFSDRIVALASGGIYAQGSPQDIITKETMSALYNLDVEISSLFEDRVRVCTSTF